jgi:D-amino-acid oxidase
MRIAIIGTGVMGLTCGLHLRRQGHELALFGERLPPDTTSARSGACFTPTYQPGSPLVQRATRASFAEFVRLAREAPESGVFVAPMTLLYHTPHAAPPWWSEFVPGFRPVELLEGFPQTFQAPIPHIEIPRYLPYLTSELAARGVTLTQRFIRNPRELLAEGFDAVVNCAGLGARELVPDPNMRPMRGQVVQIANAIGLRESFLAEARGAHATYVFAYPNHIVLGGTYEPDQHDDATSEAALGDIIERCRGVLRVAGQPQWRDVGVERLRAWAGLRPVRVVGENAEALRVERVDAGPRRQLIHNYGHGRTGVTLSWGCAAEVAALVAEA